ncbi:citrate/2-methylcitrate synthase, partial [Staphylococcus aureus]|uniref:citrate/2-methylcitrate synthase n=1 Tax=Staphylococcus aureus TaxID=1280 RepID=UPI0034D95A21
DRILATLPAIICYWYRYSHDGVRIDENTDDDSIGAQFLHLLHGKKPNQLHEQVMNVSLILYAEHEFNASTFTVRVCDRILATLPAIICYWYRYSHDGVRIDENTDDDSI